MCIAVVRLSTLNRTVVVTSWVGDASVLRAHTSVPAASFARAPKAPANAASAVTVRPLTVVQAARLPLSKSSENRAVGPVNWYSTSTPCSSGVALSSVVASSARYCRYADVAPTSPPVPGSDCQSVHVPSGVGVFPSGHSALPTSPQESRRRP